MSIIMKGDDDMKRLDGLLFGAFVADALCLAPHWIYDTQKLKLEYNQLTQYRDPTDSVFHAGKHAGELTHYGDQSLLLLKSISTENGYLESAYRMHWLTHMSHYKGYHDHATKTSLDLLKHEQWGSDSDELGGFSITSPLIFYHFDDPNLKDYIHSCVKLTHNDETLLTYSQYLVDVLLQVIIGNPLRETLIVCSKNYPEVHRIMDRLLQIIDSDTVATVKDIGQSCGAKYSFPATLYLAIKYSDDYLTALQYNILCGGDSAARGMVLGMLIGAANGVDNIPQNLIQDLSIKNTLEQFIERKKL